MFFSKRWQSGCIKVNRVTCVRGRVVGVGAGPAVEGKRVLGLSVRVSGDPVTRPFHV